MVPESFVLKGNDASGEFFGDGIRSRESPLAVGGDAGAHQLPFPALQNGADRVVEQVSRPEQPRDECQAGQKEKKQQKILSIVHANAYICII